jgi:hypothetical protein
MNLKDFGDKAKAILAGVAPTLGTALGGPFGGLAGAILAKALGTSSPNDPATEAAIVSGDPEKLLAVKKAEDDFLIQMKDLGISEEKLVYDDRANARAREISVKDWTPRILAYGVVVATVLVEGFAMLHGLPKQVDMVIAGRVLGTLDSATMLVLGYYFGTSIGSKAKDETLAQIATGP